MGLIKQLETDKVKAIEELIDNSSPRNDFFLMISLSIIMATLGIIIDNIIIIIGSMLIAPLLYPILSMSLGIVILDFKCILRSLLTILKSIALAISLSLIVTFIFFNQCQDLNILKFINSQIYLEYFIIAFVSGLAASIALLRPNVNESIPGVAISVALIPPLSILGIGLAKLNPLIIRPALIIFLINVSGITLASIIVFLSMHLFRHKKKVIKAVAKDEKIIQKTQEIKEKNNL